MKTLESREYQGLVITEPLILKKTKINKVLFWDLCGQLSRCGILRERYVDTIALCSNAKYDYYYNQEQIRRKNALTTEEELAKFYKDMYAAEKRYSTYVPILGLSPKSTLSLKLSEDNGGDEGESFFD